MPPALPSKPATIRVDGPSFAVSSDVVGLGVHSLESATFVTQNKSGGPAIVQTPILYRIGLSEDLEFRLGTNGVNFDGPHSGWSDLSPGLKWNFHADKDLSAALVASLTVPLGNPALRPISIEPSLALAFDIPVSQQTSFAFNLGANALGNGRERVVQPFATFGISQDLSERLSLALEGAAFGPNVPGIASTTAIDLGASYLINDDCQLDVTAFKGLSADGIDWAFALGLSCRW